MTSVCADSIAALLPQTQCRQCGFDGCTPYAQALSEGSAAINLCTPGGEVVMQDLAQLLNRPPQALVQANKAIAPKALAWIDEAECIGCAACIKVCPVDAIVGATKQMHTVLADECTGCELCLPPCPVDCIVMSPVTDAWLPRSRTLVEGDHHQREAAATQARLRHQHKQNRLRRQAEAKAQRLAAQKAQLAAKKAANEIPTIISANKVNPAELIAQAMARAQNLQAQRRVPDNQDEFQQQQIAKAQERATYRRAMHDFQYGNADEKAAALTYLREFKAKQAEQENVSKRSRKNR
ncbi:RnfABCDGE type electron transport complex subunit B [Snodgrassella sp. CFCC 13594]|uniref:RnfABCDGE type electron transport complex subunit B n=1 Tax=Snodgrassella sp. CFCC 13594 TaxID=1775559 RepID=UPI0008337393|nr:RnfABCDGE type electron transport complex subunit B [Snodgrassella sp. CFCC 13594]